MKLVLKGAPNPETARALERTFKIATMELNIANFAAEVHCEIKPGKAVVTRNAFFQKADAEMGQTLNHLVGNVAKMVLFSFNTPQLVQTFIHELTHVAQMLRGDLKVVWGVATWKGRRYRDPQTFAEYQNLPWEREAEAYVSNISRRLR